MNLKVLYTSCKLLNVKCCYVNSSKSILNQFRTSLKTFSSTGFTQSDQD